jgi:hypothetical protein
MNIPKEKMRWFYLMAMGPAFGLPIILGVQNWLEDPRHSIGFLMARFFIIWAVAATAGMGMGFLILRYFAKGK